MSDEEKKAIELIKKQIDFCKNNTECREELNQCFGCSIEVEDVNALEIFLNLISKLQKENEKQEKVINELKNRIENHIKFCEQESKGHIKNENCRISLRFEKHLLGIIDRKVEE